jgi:hypothetical protein
MPPVFRWLCVMEAVLVFTLGLGAIALLVYSMLWIGFGICPKIHDRLAHTINGANAAWKISLVVLLPLFFRPIFKFLIFLREVRGLKSGLEPKEKPKEEAGYESGRQLHL